MHDWRMIKEKDLAFDAWCYRRMLKKLTNDEVVRGAEETFLWQRKRGASNIRYNGLVKRVFEEYSSDTEGGNHKGINNRLEYIIHVLF